MPLMFWNRIDQEAVLAVTPATGGPVRLAPQNFRWVHFMMNSAQVVSQLMPHQPPRKAESMVRKDVIELKALSVCLVPVVIQTGLACVPREMNDPLTIMLCFATRPVVSLTWIVTPDWMGSVS